MLGLTSIALFVRPRPLANLQVWFVQNVAFFIDKSRLDVGDEILPPSPLRIALASLGWLVFIILALREKPRLSDPLARATAVPAVVFTILFIGIAPMSTYFHPLATIAIVLLFSSKSRIVALGIAVATVIGVPLAANPRPLRILAGGRTSEADWTHSANSEALHLCAVRRQQHCHR